MKRLIDHFRRSTFSHGIHPKEAKDATRNLPIRRFPFAPYLVLLLSQHAGNPAISIVTEGQRVVRGELVAAADGFVSAPIHAPATGTIQRVGHALDADGRMAPAIVLATSRGSEQELQIGQPVDADRLNPAGIIAAIRDMGMVGLGGAAFPAHVKFTPPEGKRIHTFIVNGCECEPYLTADDRVMVEYAREAVLGALMVKRALGAGRCLLAIESNKPQAIASMSNALAGETGIELVVMKTKYPQGAEKMLTEALLHKEIPSGGLPADVGAMVSNVSTLAEIGTLMPRGQGLIERVITVGGSGVLRPGNYLIPLGTPLEFILEQVGLTDHAQAVVFGGPMMGKSVAFTETPITKGVSGILVMQQPELSRRAKIFPCIRCGRCVNACPLRLNPSLLGMLARKNEFDIMAEQFHLLDCFECGCCAYVCPSNIPLVQHFRGAKQVLRERKAAA